MATLAESNCAQNGWNFAASFKHQYLITPHSEPAPGNWPSVELGKWRVGHCPNLPVAALTLTDGTVVGLVIGVAVSQGGMIIEGRHKMPVSARAEDPVALAEAYISTLAGRYVVLFNYADAARVYPDPTCSLGPVYHPQSGRVAASTALVLDRDLRDNPTIPASEVAANRARYLFGHTADAEVKRAISNHYVDLADFSVHRHWPTESLEFTLGARDFRDASDEIATKLGANVQALSGRFPTALPISGGTDSRVLLAASAPHLEQIQQFYAYHVNWSTSVDCEVALGITQAMCLPFQIISRDSTRFQQALTEAGLHDHMARRQLSGGFEPDTADARIVQAMHLVPENRMILRGNVIEMTRAPRWHRSVFDDPHNTGFAMEKLGVDANADTGFHASCVASFLDWKDRLPGNTIPRIYDFLHTELWMPHTNSAGYIRDLRHFMINPFNDRHLIHLTTCIKPIMRKRRRMVNHILQSRLPEIAAIPYGNDLVAERRKSA